MAEFHRHLLI